MATDVTGIQTGFLRAARDRGPLQPAGREAVPLLEDLAARGLMAGGPTRHARSDAGVPFAEYSITDAGRQLLADLEEA